MSPPVPLQVRLDNGRAGRRDITRRVRDLEFRITAPGGYASVTLTLDAPLSTMPSDIGFYGKVLVTDKRTGKRVCEGYLEDPGRSAGESGQLYSITALGPSSHTRDRMLPYVVVDTLMSGISRVNNTKPGFETTVGPVPNSDPNQGVVLRLPQGLTVTLNDFAAMRYSTIWYADQKVARCTYDVRAGGANANWVLISIYRTNGSLASGETGDTVGMTAAALGDTREATVVTDFNLGRNSIDFEFLQNAGGAVTAANDAHWAAFFNIVIRTVLIDKSGNEITTGYTRNHVFAHEVVADLLGRMLPLYDGANAVLTTNFSNILQLAYPDGVDAAGVLDDLMKLEATCFWMAWESNAAGKHRFEWKSWPNTPRYVASTVDGYTSTESADDLYNAVRVRYIDSTGAVRWERRTLSVPELTTLGRTRETMLDLGSDAGTQAQAQLAGDQFLLDHNRALNAGTLSVSRPILDRDTKRMVQPWEILPGYLILVRGVQPRVDALNPNPRATSTLFRIVDLTYQASGNTATLSLTSLNRTAARVITEVKTDVKKHMRRRRDR